MWTHGEAYVKPSSAWRTGFFMYEGWPAQEDGTDSQSHPSRKTHDLLYPGHTAGARRVVRGQHPGGIEDRYPSWWGHAPAALPLGSKPPPKPVAPAGMPSFFAPPPAPAAVAVTTAAAPAATLTADDILNALRAAATAAAPAAVAAAPAAPPLRSPASASRIPVPRAAQSVQPTPWAPDPEPPAPAPAPAPKPAKKKAVATATTATQTRNALHLRKLRSEFMPCVRNDVAARARRRSRSRPARPRARASSMASGNKKSPASVPRRRGVSGCSPSSPVATRPTRR